MDILSSDQRFHFHRGDSDVGGGGGGGDGDGSGRGRGHGNDAHRERHPASDPVSPSRHHHPQHGHAAAAVVPALWSSSAPTWVIRCIPPPLRFDRDPGDPVEATGLSVDVYARATVVMSSMFLGPALLRLATDAAVEASGCNDDVVDGNYQEGDDTSCRETARIYGFRPSSLLSNIAIAAGLMASVLLPLFGAIIDHTKYRRQVGAYTALGLVCLKATETAVSSSTWLFVAAFQLASSVLYNLHITTIYAYVSELTTDVTKRTTYNTFYAVVLYVSTLLFMMEVIFLSSAIGAGDIGTARISQITTTTTSAPLFYVAWRYLFRNRMPLSQIPPGMGLLSCGFYKVYQTGTIVYRHHGALSWLILAIMFGEAAMTALITIATTYMTQVLRMESAEIGAVFFVVLVMAIPGSKLGETVSIRVVKNPTISARIADVAFIVTTTLASKSLRGPDDKGMAMFFGAMWGISMGWLSPLHTTSFMSIIPRGSDAEFMGIYILSCQLLSWLPPLVFTVLNEYRFDMSYGLASLNLYFACSIGCFFMMGNYDRAVEQVGRSPPSPSYSIPPAQHASPSPTEMREMI